MHPMTSLLKTYNRSQRRAEERERRQPKRKGDASAEPATQAETPPAALSYPQILRAIGSRPML